MLNKANQPDNLIREFVLFNSLTDRQMAKIMDSLSVIKLAKNERLFSEGEEAKRFFLLKNGRIKLFHTTSNSTETVLEVILPGGNFALASMFMGKKNYTVHAEAIMMSCVYAFDNVTFLNILRESPAMCFRVMSELSERLRKLVMKSEQLNTRCAPTRLANYFLNKAADSGETLVRLDIPKREIASLLSIQPETFSRAFMSLKKQGFIEEKDGGYILINKTDKLLDFVGRCSQKSNSKNIKSGCGNFQ